VGDDGYRWTTARWPSLLGGSARPPSCHSQRTDTIANPRTIAPGGNVRSAIEHAGILTGVLYGSVSPAFRDISDLASRGCVEMTGCA
jgi:hypothetical protein